MKPQHARNAKTDADPPEGKLIPRSQCDDALLGLGIMFRHLFQQLGDSLAHGLPNGDPAVNEPYIRQRFNDAIERLSQQETLELNRIDHAPKYKPRR